MEEEKSPITPTTSQEAKNTKTIDVASSETVPIVVVDHLDNLDGDTTVPITLDINDGK